MRSRNHGLALLGAAAVALGLTAGAANAQVTINEVRIDQTGTDTDEYFELKGTAGASLAGYYYIVIGDGTGGCGTVESVTNLGAHSIQADGLFALRNLLASPVLTGYDASDSLFFENNDNVTHLLVTNFSGTRNMDLDTNNDGILDVTPWTSIVDCIGVIEEVGPSCGLPQADDEPVYCGTTIGPDGLNAPGHIYRCADTNAWMIGPFNPVGGLDSPGSANPTCLAPPPNILVERRTVCAPLIGQSVTVTDSIINATSATLTYSVNGGAGVPVVMTNVGNLWSATIPGQGVNGTRVSYSVAASNAQGNDTGFVWGYFTGTMTIAALRPVDGSGNATYRFYGARITGNVTVAQGTFSTVNTDFWIQDGTGGMRIFKFGLPSVSPGLGDEVEIAGEVDQFNGLTELENSTACGDLDITINSPGSVPAPLMVNTCSLGEETEGLLVRMQFPQVDTTGSNSTNWVGNRSYTIRNCHPNTDVMFVDADTDIDGTPVLALQADITGLSGQFDSNTPFTGNYQIIPRGLADIIPVQVAGTPGTPTGLKPRLLPNAPNPFTTATNIRFDVAGAGEARTPLPVQINVYDVAGRKITTLLDEMKTPGSYEITLDAGRLGDIRSGIFFYDLQIDGKTVATRKLVLSR